VILFLHGAGERGDDGISPTKVGLGPFIAKRNFPAIVVFPQCSKDSWWTVTEMENQAMSALNASVKEFNGDARRTYLTGLSMGGYGTWSFATHHYDRFAALVPICGGVKIPQYFPRVPVVSNDEDPYAFVAMHIRGIPVWIFHGAEDTTVPIEESRLMYATLKALGNNCRYTEYPKIGHESWDQAYSEPGLFNWLFKQRIRR